METRIHAEEDGLILCRIGKQRYFPERVRSLPIVSCVCRGIRTAVILILGSCLALSVHGFETETEIREEDTGLLARLYEANVPDTLMEMHEQYDRTSIFWYPDGSSFRVYSFRDAERIVRLQDDMAILVEEAKPRGFRREPDTREWTAWEIIEEDWPDFRSQVMGAFTWDAQENVDMTVQIDQYLHIETSADVVLYDPLLRQLGLQTGDGDWIACTYDVDPDTLEAAFFTSTLMHPDGTSDPLNTISWRYDASVPGQEPEQAFLEEGLPDIMK